METESDNEQITEEEIMFEIGNVLVSLDVAEQYFCCDISQCLGQCCIDGDAGAPITVEEQKELENALPAVMPDLLPASRKVIEEEGSHISIVKEILLHRSLTVRIVCSHAMTKVESVSVPLRKLSAMANAVGENLCRAICTRCVSPSIRHLPP